MWRRWLVAVLICVIALSSIAAYALLQPKPAYTVILETPEIGTFYYLWYGALSDDWETPKFVDTPILNKYNSSDLNVIKQQLIWMQEAGLDFAVISWWGASTDYGKSIDNAAKQVFQVAQEINSYLKFSIMVEPFNLSSGINDFEEIYGYIWENFVAPYPLFYYDIEEKPVIYFYNNQNMTDNGNFLTDPRFTVITVGQQSNSTWTYLDDANSLPHTNQVSVIPRFDDSRLNRTQNSQIDPDLSQGIYDQQWQRAIQLWKAGEVNIIMVTSWNEFPERTAIEPHYDATAKNTDPFFLYEKTKTYVNQIHRLAAANYLKSHFNSDIKLIYESEENSFSLNAPEYHLNQVYYLYSDNLLAANAMKPYDPEISAQINKTIESYDLPSSDFFEVLFGKKISFGMFNAYTEIIGNYPDKIVLAEFRNYSDPIKGQYADALIYQSLNSYLKGDRVNASNYFNQALSMWDGKGIKDDAAKKDGKYANYKLALIMYSSKVLQIEIDKDLEMKLWSMQQTNGGITSLADLDGNPVGSANAETTSMVLLAYDNQLISHVQELFGKGL